MADRKRQETTTDDSSLVWKKQKLDEINDDGKDSGVDIIDSWSNFQIKRVLNNNVVRKQIWLEGRFKGDDEKNVAIVLMEKKSFPEESSLLTNFFDKQTQLLKTFDNDAYGSYECIPQTGEHIGLKTTVIYPATEKHLEKFIKKKIHLVEETPQLYKTVTVPKVIGQRLSLQWVENILNHKSEVDRIIYEDTDEEKGFVLLPDLKWDGNVNTLNVLAISRAKITCIRELNQSHLPLLRNIRDAGVAAIVDKYGIAPSRLRIFFHYLPSYYHLHVHFTELSVEDAGIYTEKAHLLSTVINNIQLLPDYYQKATLTFAIFNSEFIEDYQSPPTPPKLINEPQHEC